MRTRRLGSHGPEISVVGFGAWEAGGGSEWGSAKPDDQNVEDTWGAMTELVDEGLVRHIGVSNFDRDLVERCEAIRHVDSLQPELSMLHLDNRDLIAWCGERGIGTITYGPLAYGILTGHIGPDSRFDP